MKSVLCIVRGTEGYGEAGGLARLLAGLASEEVRVGALFGHRGRAAERLAGAGIRLRRLRCRLPDPYGRNRLPKALQLARNGGRSLRLAAEISRRARQVGAAVLHVRRAELLPAVALAGRWTGARPVWQVPVPPDSARRVPLGRWTYGMLCRALGVRALANSRYTRDRLASALLRPAVLHIGVDPERFDPDSVSPAPVPGRVVQGAPTFGTVARLVPDKAQDLVVRALGELRDALPDARYVCVGGDVDSPYARRLRVIADECGMADRLHLAGFSPEPERWYPHIDVYVNSARRLEPYGQSIVEAMMMRRPVLARDAGGPRDTVVDGRTGWLVPGRGARAYRKGLLRAWRARNRWEEMGRSGRRRALDRFTVDAYVGRYRRLTGLHAPDPV